MSGWGGSTDTRVAAGGNGREWRGGSTHTRATKKPKVGKNMKKLEKLKASGELAIMRTGEVASMRTGSAAAEVNTPPRDKNNRGRELQYTASPSTPPPVPPPSYTPPAAAPRSTSSQGRKLLKAAGNLEQPAKRSRRL